MFGIWGEDGKGITFLLHLLAPQSYHLPFDRACFGASQLSLQAGGLRVLPALQNQRGGFRIGWGAMAAS